jgi:hypothetical protein
MGKILVVAEKPSVARDLAGARGDLLEHDVNGAGDASTLPFLGLAHVDQLRLARGYELLDARRLERLGDLGSLLGRRIGERGVILRGAVRGHPGELSPP